MRAAIRLLGLSGVVALTAACNPPESAEPPQPVEPAAAAGIAAPAIGYACESGQTISVAYPDADTARLTYQGQVHDLRAVPAASGARYSGDGLEWWTATRDGQESATLGRLGPNEEVGGAVLERCGRPAPAPTGPVPGVPGVQTPAPGGVLPASAPCRGPQLRLAVEGTDAGAGNRMTTLAVTNAGAQPCSLTGYPTVALHNARGQAVEGLRAETHPGAYLRAGQAPTPVELPPQGRAFFDIGWNVVPREGQGETACPSVARLRVTAPGDTAPVSVDQALTPCGGRVLISPFRALADPDAAPAGQPAANRGAAAKLETRPDSA